MRTYKRVAAILAASLLALAACGGDDADTATESTTETTEVVEEVLVPDQAEVEEYADETGTPVNNRDGAAGTTQDGYTIMGHDQNEDGYFDAFSVDRWYDGYFDVLCFDQDQNGFNEYCMLDMNNDAYHEMFTADTSGNGFMDVALLDTDLNGDYETRSQDINENGIPDSVDPDPVFSSPDRGYSIVSSPTNPDWLYNLMIMGVQMGAGPTFPPGDSDGDGTFDNSDDCPSNPGAYSNFGC